MPRSGAEEYEKRLRKIFLSSADVLPSEVLTYIKKVESSGAWGAIEQVRDEFRPLIDAFPREYADYFLKNLIKNTDNVDDDFRSSHSDHNLGLSGNHDFFPPSPSQGPFWYLLRKNEDEGLRLIHTLSNYAVQHWRKLDARSHINGETYTRLPVKVTYKSITHEFWGDNSVYSWFRPTHNGPDSVSSALMALEVWMEGQIESGRDAEELFAKVLLGSECVAVPGVCISIALEYPEACLKAALPLVSQPMFWHMDIARFVLDSSTTNFGGLLAAHEIHDTVVNERNKRPQRKSEIRHLAYRYLFSSDEELGKNFSDAVAQFTINLPFHWEEDKHSPESIEIIKRDMELFQVYGARENFRRYEDEKGVWIYAEQPQHIKERLAPGQKEMQERMAATQVWIWVTNSLSDGKLSELLKIEQAYSLVREYYSEITFPDTLELYKFTDHRLEAIIGVSAAILFLGHDWLDKIPDSRQEIIDWCRSILLQTAKTPAGTGYHDRGSKFLFHPKAAAALGLGSLLTNGIATTEEKEQLIRLAGNEYVAVALTVFRSLPKDAWIGNPVVCWIALSLAVNVALSPMPKRPDYNFLEREEDPYETQQRNEKNRINDLIEQHLGYLEKGTVPEIPKIPSPTEIRLRVDLLSSIVQYLPTTDLLSIDSAKAKFLSLHDNLLAWTIAVNSHEENESEPYVYDSWNDDFFNWATKLFTSFSNEEMQEHLFDPLKGTFPNTQKLTADLLINYAYNRLGSYEPLSTESIEGWKYICEWVLEYCRQNNNSVNLRRSRNWESLNAIIFVRYNCLWNDTWPHVALFSDIIREWVELVGHKPRRVSMLLVMLNVLWKYFEPSHIILWFNHIVNAAGKELWKTNENGSNTANLLGKLWKESEDKITEDVLVSYSKIVDSLVSFGIPSARRLQEILENTSKNR